MSKQASNAKVRKQITATIEQSEDPLGRDRIVERVGAELQVAYPVVEGQLNQLRKAGFVYEAGGGYKLP